MFAFANYKGLKMNKATLKSRATLLGKVFAEKGVTLARAEQLDLVAQLEGARDWHHASGEVKGRAVSAENIPLDSLQLEAAQAYCEGDFLDVKSKADVAAKGDMLFHFLMDEIGDIQGNREEAVNLMRQASEELDSLADALEANAQQLENALVAKSSTTLPLKAEKLAATDAKGVPVDWRVRWLTNRLGETDIVDAYGHQDLRNWLDRHPAELKKLWEVCLEEMAFVAELNGVRGVLYEVEMTTTESEGTDKDGTPRCSVSADARRAQLQRQVAEMEVEHPKVTWVVAGPTGMWDGRVGVWGFCPEAQLLTKDEAHAVVDSLVKKFYS